MANPKRRSSLAKHAKTAKLAAAFRSRDRGAAGGARLALALASAQRSLAEHLAQHFFQVEAPPAMQRPVCKSQSYTDGIARPD